MKIIQHRINRVEQYKKIAKSEYGIEADVRYDKNDLVLHHDPFHHHETPIPEKFETLLQQWKNTGTMILNIKTEGIEQQCIELMKKYNIQNWFFLDLSMPYFAIYAEKAFRREIAYFSPENLAVRFSERENLAYALGFAGKASWMWVDCFTKLPLNKNNYAKIKKANFKICLVAPELQSHPLEKTKEFQEILKRENIIPDAVCTKYPELWESYANKIS